MDPVVVSIPPFYLLQYSGFQRVAYCLCLRWILLVKLSHRSDVKVHLALRVLLLVLLLVFVELIVELLDLSLSLLVCGALHLGDQKRDDVQVKLVLLIVVLLVLFLLHLASAHLLNGAPHTVLVVDVVVFVCKEL